MSVTTPRIFSQVPAQTLDWLLEPDNPAVAVLTRRTLLGERDDAETAALWARRNEYTPVAAILDKQLDDGSWAPPPRDYQKYWGSLWQIHLLGELWADGDEPRVRKAAEYAFSRQLADGSWSCSNAQPRGSIPCLTANVGRALARMGWARDERVVSGLGYLANLYRELGVVDCLWAQGYHLNGYCHMLTVKEMLFLAEVPSDLWPSGCQELRDACVAELRDKTVFRSLPAEAREFNEALQSLPAAERPGLRERFLAEHPAVHFGEKPGWLRFGYPLSYNSDALEALWALMRVGEEPREEYRDAIEVVRSAADGEMRWKLRTSFNGRMLADVETKGQPSKWLTLRALQVLDWAEPHLREAGL